MRRKLLNLPTLAFNLLALVRRQPLYIPLRVTQGPMFLVNSPQGNIGCGPPKLLRAKAGRAYPEVTPANLPSSLRRTHPLALVECHQPTCVGLRYGSHKPPTRLFSEGSSVR